MYVATIYVSPSQLVPLARQVKADDTMRQYRQHLRFDFIFGANKCQVMWDRRHKINKKLSKPLGYFPLSEVSELMNLVTGSFSLLLVHQLQPCCDDVELEKALDSAWSLIKKDVIFLTRICLSDIEKKRKMEDAKLG